MGDRRGGLESGPGARTPHPAPPAMTARRSDGDKPLKRTPRTVDAQALLDYIEEQNRVTLSGLAKTAGLPKREIKQLLGELREHDLVTVEPRLKAVWIKATQSERPQWLSGSGETAPETSQGEDNPEHNYPPSAKDKALNQGSVRDDNREEHTKNVFGLEVEDSARADGGPVRRIIHALTGSDQTLQIAEEDLYDCLGNARRRRILRYLAAFYDEHNRVYIPTQTVANALADRMREDAVNEAARDDDRRHRHYVSISQVHATYLDELGLIEHYDRVNKLRATEDGVAVASIMTEVSEMCVDQTDEQTKEVE